MKSRITTSMVGQTAPNFCLPSAGGRVCLADYSGRRHIILYYMPRFASTLAWRGAIALGGLYDSLQARDIEVLVIGRGDYLRPATRFAAGLGLPFLFLNDAAGTVFRLYGLDEIGRAPPTAVTIVVDKRNVVRFVYRGNPPGEVVDTGRLMSAVKWLDFYQPLAPSINLCRPVRTDF